MPAYNFQQQFVQPILAGTKTKTIRPRRKNPTREGQQLYLYTGMRTKQCKLIAEKVCIAVVTIFINTEYKSIHIGADPNRYALTSNEVNEFAVSDGFEDSHEFFQFFAKRYTQEQMDFDLEIVVWR